MRQWLEFGRPFVPMVVREDYVTWPLLTSLMPSSFPGVMTSRDGALVDIDQDALRQRMQRYFDPAVSDAEIADDAPELMKQSSRFDPLAQRKAAISEGMKTGSIVRYCYRPFDTRYLYWYPHGKLLDEKRPDFFPQVVRGNYWLAAVQQNRRDADAPCVTEQLAARHLIERGANYFPQRLKQSAERLFEYACHEGNYEVLRGIFAAARAREKDR